MNKRYYSYNRIHPLAHVFSEGDYLPKITNVPTGIATIQNPSGLVGTRTVGPTSQQQRALNMAKLSSGIKNLPGGVLNAAVGVVGNAINPKGNTSKVGNFISGAGDVVSMVNPLWGAAVKGVGMLTNAAFGANVNTEAVNGLNSDLLSARDSIGNSLTWDTLADNIQDLGSINVEGADLGSQGWFSHAVDRERDRLRAQEKQARGALAYATDNINTLQNRQAMGTLLANGGGIHIKPSKKGTFTAQATKMGMGVQEAASHILANKENYSPAMVKKANFAKNASKWHADGGPIFKTDYDMGLTFVNAGGTHEQNPYGGVFMGMAPDGQPNQVEEGEVIFNDYVYSNRLKVPKAVRNKYKMREKKELSFADAIEEYIRKNGIEERNNDPIANRGLEAFASELAMEQEMVKAKKEMKESRQAAFGGHLFSGEQKGSSRMTRLGTGKGSRDERWQTYALPWIQEYFNDALDRFNNTQSLEEKAAIRQEFMDTVNNMQRGYAGIYNQFGKETGTPNDAVRAYQSNWDRIGGNSRFGNIGSSINYNYGTHGSDSAARGFKADGLAGPITETRFFGDSLADPETMAGLNQIANAMNLNWGATLDYGDAGNKLYMLSAPENAPAPVTSAPSEAPPSEPEVAPTQPMQPAAGVAAAANSEKEESIYDPTYWWRMAGLGANAAGLMYNIFDPYHPQVVNEAGYSTISPKYIGDYMEYRPYDINYATSQQDANSAATRNALMQSSAPIRNALLLANDFNNNATRGATRRQALEYNDALRKAVADFNRGTNQFNTQMYMDAASKNQAARQAYYQDRLRQAQFNSQMDFHHKMMRDQAIGQGLTAIGDWFDAVRRENTAREGAEVFASIMGTPNEEAKDYIEKEILRKALGYCYGGPIKKRRK